MGHAGYANNGKHSFFKGLFHKEQPDFDIVCCAVSVLVTNTNNSLEILSKDKVSVTTNEETGFMHFVFDEPLSEEGKLLMDSLVLGLSHIEEEYGQKYLKLTFEEV